MKIIIVRHGDPDYSIDSLTEKGWLEARLLSERLAKLDISKIYCSPLGRAKDTASFTLKATGKNSEILDWLREFPAQINDEKGNKIIPWDLMPEKWSGEAMLYQKDQWLKHSIMDCENLTELYNNVCSEFDKLLENHGYKKEKGYYRVLKPNSDTIVLFCHFGLECVLLSRLLNTSPVLFWQGFIATPTSVTTLITEERKDGVAFFRCNSFGDISHLYANDESPAFAGRFCEMFSNTHERH